MGVASSTPTATASMPPQGEPDSRNAAVGHKRKATLEHGSRPSSSTGSSSSSKKPKKAKLGHQDVRDFVPPGATFTAAGEVLEDPECLPEDKRQPASDSTESQYPVPLSPTGRDGSQVETLNGLGSRIVSPKLQRSDSAANTVNWNNTTNKPTIRTSLGNRNNGSSSRLATTATQVKQSSPEGDMTRTDTDNEEASSPSRSPSPSRSQASGDGEEGELSDSMSESSDESSDHGGIMLNVDESEYDSQSDANEDDPMLDYSDASAARQPSGDPATNITSKGREASKDGERPAADSSNDSKDEGEIDADSPAVLADLSPEVLASQLKYVHVGQEANSIDMSQPVTCLVCFRKGHLEENCPSFQCQQCGAIKKHWTRNCPQIQRCMKCRERGHSKQNCPYKVPRVNESNIPCDRCNLAGHFEDQCDRMWQTYLPTPGSGKVLTVAYASCSNCGCEDNLGYALAPHFVGDCPTLPPVLSFLRDSPWSLFAMEPAGYTATRYIDAAQSKTGGFRIKGRAPQPSHIRFDDRDDEEDDNDISNFRQNKINKPAKGKIAIKGLGGPKTHNERDFDRNHYSPPARPAYDDYDGRNDAHGNAGYQDYRDPGRYSRPVSPRPQMPQRQLRRYDEEDWQPPLPQGPPPPRGRDASRDRRGGGGSGRGRGKGASYRPMPSAASRAWKKTRT